MYNTAWEWFVSMAASKEVIDTLQTTTERNNWFLFRLRLTNDQQPSSIVITFSMFLIYVWNKDLMIGISVFYKSRKK